jgi:hypothetical protein
MSVDNWLDAIAPLDHRANLPRPATKERAVLETTTTQREF